MKLTFEQITSAANGIIQTERRAHPSPLRILWRQGQDTRKNCRWIYKGNACGFDGESHPPADGGKRIRFSFVWRV